MTQKNPNTPLQKRKQLAGGFDDQHKCQPAEGDTEVAAIQTNQQPNTISMATSTTTTNLHQPTQLINQEAPVNSRQEVKLVKTGHSRRHKSNNCRRYNTRFVEIATNSTMQRNIRRGIGKNRSRLPRKRNNRRIRKFRKTAKPFFWDTTEQQDSPNSRPSLAKSVYTEQDFQDGRNEGSKELNKQGLILNENRFNRCLSQYSNTQGLSKVLSFQIQEENIQIYKNAIWTQYCTKNFYTNYENCPQTVTTGWFQIRNLFVRYINYIGQEDFGRTASNYYCQSFGDTWIQSKYEEINLNSEYVNRVFRQHNQYGINDYFHPALKMSKNNSRLEGNYKNVSITNQETRCDFWVNIIDLRDARRLFNSSEISSSKHSEIFKKSSKLESKRCNRKEHKIRSCLTNYANPTESRKKLALARKRDDSSTCGCIKKRLWFPQHEQRSNRGVDYNITSNVIELQGIENCTDSPSSKWSKMARQKGSNSLTQLNYGKPNQSPKQTETSSSITNLQGNISDNTQSTNRNSCRAHKGSGKHESRLPKSSSQRRKRMVTELESNEENSKKIWKDNIRLVCFPDKHEGSEICLKDTLASLEPYRCPNNEILANEFPSQPTNWFNRNMSVACTTNQSKENIGCNTELANTPVVSNFSQCISPLTIKTDLATSSRQEKQEIKNSISRDYRMESILQMNSEDLDDETIKTISKSERKAIVSTC